MLNTALIVQRKNDGEILDVVLRGVLSGCGEGVVTVSIVRRAPLKGGYERVHRVLLVVLRLCGLTVVDKLLQRVGVLVAHLEVVLVHELLDDGRPLVVGLAPLGPEVGSAHRVLLDDLARLLEQLDVVDYVLLHVGVLELAVPERLVLLELGVDPLLVVGRRRLLAGCVLPIGQAPPRFEPARDDLHRAVIGVVVRRTGVLVARVPTACADSHEQQKRGADAQEPLPHDSPSIVRTQMQ